jgi:NitT/TauT family transport system substrate-binding protein
LQSFNVSLVAPGRSAFMSATKVCGRCFEVLAKDNIRSIADLKGRTVGVYGSGDEWLLKIMASLVGLDPVKDIRWIPSLSRGPEDLFIEGKVDAFLAGPPGLQELRTKNIGHVIASSIADRPWSQYFCCMLVSHQHGVCPKISDRNRWNPHFA